MSKKKRKTRSQKEAISRHHLEHLVKKMPKTVTTEKSKKDKITEEAPVDSAKVPAFIVRDFKKVSLIIGIILIFILILWLIVYRTDILDGLLSRFQISY